MDEQTQVDSSDVQERLTSFFTQEPDTAAEEQQAEAPTAEPEIAQEAQPEGEPFEIDGEQYVLPAKLKEKVSEWKEHALRREDYTRKTQELAELTRQARGLAEAFQSQQALETEVATERSELAGIKKQLDQFKEVNWLQLSAEQTGPLVAQLTSLKMRHDELDASIKGKNEQFVKSLEGRKQEALQSAQRYLTTTVKGWGPEAVGEAQKAAKDLGYTDAELESVYDPRFVRAMYEIAQFRKQQAGKSAALAAVQKVPPVLKAGASQPGVAAEAKYRDARKALAKSGSLKDAARLFMMKD